MISGLVILSEPENMKYPYIEAIESMLPVVGEMVVILNPFIEDGARDKLEPN